MTVFQLTLLLAAFLSSLLAGFLFAFAVIVMPGIKRLDNLSFLRAFQAIDRVIQNNQPLFMVVWIGSAITLVAAVLLSFGNIDFPSRFMLMAAAIVHFLGVQLPTVVVNIPLNNKLQETDLSTLNQAEINDARSIFESRWNRWNRLRTILSCLISLTLLFLLLR